MAANKNKRVATKHIRDGIKSNYKKKDFCEVCGTEDNLELHHYHTVSLLLKNYAKENGIAISTDEEVLAMRDEFYKVYWHELVEDTVTLCNTHHVKLHKVYSQEPALHTAKAQRRWVTIQHGKLNGVSEITEMEIDRGSNVTSSDSEMLNFKVRELDLSSFKV